MSKKHISTALVHQTFFENDPYKSVSNPLYLSTTFERNEKGEVGDFLYNRADNPNRIALEKKLALLENATTAICFSSGLAACQALFHNLLKPDSHVILPNDCYHGTRQLVEQFYTNWKVSFTLVDMTDAENIKNAINENTALIWIETPSNPQLKITNIQEVVSLAKKQNITTVADNTFATPLLQKPLELGVDYVMHSTTKFMSGHSDILGGVVLTNHATKTTSNIKLYQKSAGAVPSPFDCWLLDRSLATLPLRFKKQNKNALEIATFLEKHPKIATINYPGLATHTQHELAKKQMTGFGSIISIELKADEQKTLFFASNLSLFKHATSLGGVESLIEHRRSIEGEHPVSPENLLRISVGIEDVQDLINDLNQNLEKL
jgi:cystathionine gamma-synthase